MIACTMPDEKYFRYEQEHGESQCEMYDSCEECPWYDEKKGDVGICQEPDREPG